MVTTQTVIIIHMGGQLAPTVARKIRDKHIFCEVLPYTASVADIHIKSPIGLILAGVSSHRTTIESNLQTMNIPILYIENANEMEQLDSFLFGTCHALADWDLQLFIDQAVQEIALQVGTKSRVLLALSGGVDSMVVAALLHRAIGDRLTCVFVNHGLMRKDEPEQVIRIFEQTFSAKLIAVDASEQYFARLSGITDPEQKRKIIGAIFIEVFEAEAAKLGTFEFLAQGTIYPDIIESGMTPSDDVIKSHHNVGGLPEKMGFACVEPLRMLFKDEVRKVGIALGLPEAQVYRQPFPGPGLGVRVMGEVTKEKVRIVREADAIYRDEIEKAGLSRSISQYFAALLSIKTIGIRDGRPSHDHVISLRAVQTSDFMQAAWIPVPFEVLATASTRITAEVQGVSRVLFDITNKPPAPIEWE